MAARTRATLGAMIAMTALAGCITGERPRLGEPPGPTGDPAADAVLARLDAADDVTFTASYRIVTSREGMTNEATVVRAGPRRRSVTIGDVRYLEDRGDRATCELGDGCANVLDPSRVSDLQVTPDFYGASAAARLRADVERRVGPTAASTERIADQPATCVDVPTAERSVRYCALDQGPLARLEGPDVTVELTGFALQPDEGQFARTG